MRETSTYNLTEITSYAHGIGPKWSVIFNRTDPNDLAKPSKLVDEAHSLGLLVHGYIF